MPDAQMEFVDGPAANPPDVSQVVAIIGYCSDLAPSGDPAAPNVQVFDSPTPVKAAAGYGPGSVASHWLAEKTKKRVLLCPIAAVVAGILSAVTQVGQGPVCTVSAAAGGPYDDASVQWRIKAGGAAGTATFELSYSFLLVNGNPQRLWRPALTVPERTRASATGTVDLSTLTYAKPAAVTGTVDLSTLTYGSGGSLDGLTLIADTFTTTFAAPANPAAVATQINAAYGATVASVNQQNHLVLTSVAIGGSAAVDITGGTGRATLGLIVHTYNGTAGALDGLTLILDEDTTSPQTVTFTTPKDPAAVVAAVTAKTNITAELFSTKNLLRVYSDTRGSASRLNITGGTGRATLGLAIPAAPYEGAESAYPIEHLGFTIEFSPSSNGVFIAGTLYSATCVAPRADATEINRCIDDLVTAGYPFGRILIPQETDISTLLAQASSIDSKMGELEAAEEFLYCTMIGADVAETDTNIRNTFASFTSRRIDRCGRGVYLTTSLIPGGGDTLRSSSWLAAYQAAVLPLGKDRGDHSYPALPCNGITGNETTATVKLVGAVGAPGSSWNVIDGKPGRYYFSGGYSSADGTSGYCDQSTRDTVIRSAEVAQGVLNGFVNVTSLDTGAGGRLTAGAAATVDAAVEAAVSEAVVPAAALGVKADTDRTTDFYNTKSLRARIVIGNRTPARAVHATIGPGIIETGDVAAEG